MEHEDNEDLQSNPFEEVMRERVMRGRAWTVLPPPEGRVIRYEMPNKRMSGKGSIGTGQPFAGGRRSSGLRGD